MSFDPKDPRLVHVYPNVVGMPDEYEHGDGPSVAAPMTECALCQVGICQQRLDDVCPEVVVHSRKAPDG